MGSCAPVGGNEEVIAISCGEDVAQNKTQGNGPHAEQTLDSAPHVWKTDRKWTPKQARDRRTGCGEGLDDRAEE